MEWVSLNKHKIAYEKVSVVNSIYDSKDSLKKVCKLQIQFSVFDFLTGYSVLFLCYLKLISIWLFETIVFMLFGLMLFGT